MVMQIVAALVGLLCNLGFDLVFWCALAAAAACVLLSHTAPRLRKWIATKIVC